MIFHNPDRSVRALLRSLLPAVAALLAAGCFGSSGSVGVELRFEAPQANQLSMTGDTGFVLSTGAPGGLDAGSLNLYLNEQAITPTTVTVSDGEISGEINIDASGVQTLRAEVMTASGRELGAEVSFETAELAAPENCEILNQAECMLPYPSSRFLEAAEETPTGVRLALPENGTPTQNNDNPVHLSPEPYHVLDGYSPTVQVLMHFQGAGVDVAASDAPRILEATRTTDDRSLEVDSPTVLLDTVTGERIHHWVEVDVRAENPERQVLFLRPGLALEPGRRYIVAVRNLVDVEDNAIEAEPAFAALRDGRPTDIAPLEARREGMEAIFAELGGVGVARDDLLLAFDFVVQSEQGLTFQMQAMLDETLTEIASDGAPEFTVDEVIENDCEAGGFTWREIRGTYEVPLYLDNDPEIAPEDLSFLVTDENGNPQQVGTTNPPFTIAIPCALLDNEEVIRPVLVGHGLFGTGRGTISQLVGATGLEDLVFISGATDFRGLSTPDINPPQGDPVIIDLFADMDNFAALPDRLRQGMLNTLVLGHMMKQGHFNAHSAFQTPGGEDVFPGPAEEMYYFGGSLGGIMGTMYSALTSDADKLNVDVPAINFSLMLQRATPFSALMPVFESLVNDDFMQQALILGMIHELWVRGEPAGYMSLLRNRLAAETPEIDLLITVAWLDQQVTNLGSELIPRTLGVPQVLGSFQSTSGPFPGGLPVIEDRPGPLRSAYVVYDTGLYDLTREDHEPFIPPLTNQPAETENSCNPHGLRGFIPASVAQLINFFQPGGMIENFCEGGVCDGSTDFNSPLGDNDFCDPAS